VEKSTLASIEDNVLKPAANGLLDGWNVAANMGNAVSRTLGAGSLFGKADLYSIPHADVGSGAWLCQTVTGGLSAIVPYVVAAKFVGAGLRTAGRAAGAEGVAANLLSSDAIAQVSAAGLIDASRDLKPGETRLANAAGSMVGFGLFEVLNPAAKALSITQRIAARAAIGAAGATGQQITAHALSGRALTSSELIDSAVHGAAMNIALPAVQSGLTRASTIARANLGLGIPIRDFASFNDYTGKSPMLDSLMNKTSLTNVYRTNGAYSRADNFGNSIYIARAGDAADFGHELSHIENRGQIQAAQNAISKEGTFFGTRPANVATTVKAEAHLDTAISSSITPDSPGLLLQSILNHKTRPLGVRSSSHEAGLNDFMKVVEADETLARQREAKIAADFGLSNHEADRSQTPLYAVQATSLFEALKSGRQPTLAERVLYNDRKGQGGNSGSTNETQSNDKGANATDAQKLLSQTYPEYFDWMKDSRSKLPPRILPKLDEALADGSVRFAVWDRIFLRSIDVFARDMVRPRTQKELVNASNYDPFEATQPILVVRIEGADNTSQYHVINGNNRIFLFGSSRTNPTNEGLPLWFFKDPETFKKVFNIDATSMQRHAQRVFFP